MTEGSNIDVCCLMEDRRMLFDGRKREEGKRENKEHMFFFSFRYKYMSDRIGENIQIQMLKQAVNNRS